MNQSDYFACECKGTNANLPPVVTWYKNSAQIVTGKEKAILVFSNVDKDDSGTYRCEARTREKAKNETSIELIVICKYIDAHVALVSSHVPLEWPPKKSPSSAKRGVHEKDA